MDIRRHFPFPHGASRTQRGPRDEENFRSGRAIRHQNTSRYLSEGNPRCSRIRRTFDEKASSWSWKRDAVRYDDQGLTGNARGIESASLRISSQWEECVVFVTVTWRMVLPNLELRFRLVVLRCVFGFSPLFLVSNRATCLASWAIFAFPWENWSFENLQNTRDMEKCVKYTQRGNNCI